MGGRGSSSKRKVGCAYLYTLHKISLNKAGRIADVVFKNANLNNRQIKINYVLKKSGDTIKVHKKNVSNYDLVALSCKNQVEYALFTSGSKRIVVRGGAFSTDISDKLFDEIKKGKYKLSGHIHPGETRDVLRASEEDKNFLKMINQKRSSIYNYYGSVEMYGQY